MCILPPNRKTIFMLSQTHKNHITFCRSSYKPRAKYRLRQRVLTKDGSLTQIYWRRWHDGLFKTWFYYCKNGKRYPQHEILAALETFQPFHYCLGCFNNNMIDQGYQWIKKPCGCVERWKVSHCIRCGAHKLSDCCVYVHCGSPECLSVEVVRS